MAIYRGVGGASSTTSAANTEEVLQASVEAQAAAAEAAASAISSASSAASAANTYDDFDDRYLGAKTSDPAVDNDGDALAAGALYFDTVQGAMKVYDGSSWAVISSNANVETKTLTSGTLSYVMSSSPAGAVFYIAGDDADNGRLVLGDDYTVNVATKTVTLTQSYPAGTKLIMAFLDAAATSITDAEEMTYTYPTGSATERTVESKLSDTVSVKDFGAVGDGVTDDTAAIQAAESFVRSNGGALIHPPGQYLRSGVVYNVQKTGFWFWDNYVGGVDSTGSAAATSLLLTSDTEDTTIYDSVKNKTPLAINTTINGVQHGNCIRFQNFNLSSNSDGNTGIYGKVVSDVNTSWTAGYHIETYSEKGTNIGLNVESRTYNSLGATYGIVLNNVCNTDGSLHPITSNPITDNQNTHAIHISGNADVLDAGGWQIGINFDNYAIKETATADGIRFNNFNGRSLLRSTTASTADVDIFLEGDSAVGITLAGTYTTGDAIRINQGQAISFDTSGNAGVKSDGTVIEFDNAGTSLLKLYKTANITEVPTIRPFADNTYSSGTASRRWSVVYAGTGTINTSDEREKTPLLDLDATEKAVANELKQAIKKFKFKDAVEAKGESGARIHVGVGAQTVKAIFESHGLVAEDYAILCYDEWVDEETGETRNRYGVRYEELLAFIISAM